MKAKAVKITDGVYWVGVLHWNSRTFHGYGIPGTTYNAYLVFGEDKTVLIDNVYQGMFEQFDARVKDAFDQEGRECADPLRGDPRESQRRGTVPESASGIRKSQ